MTEPALAASIDRLDDWLRPALLALLMLYHVLRTKKGIDAYSDVSPRVSGAVTVMLVGTAAAIALVSYSAELATGASLVSMLATVAIWRFATINADQIGRRRSRRQATRRLHLPARLTDRVPFGDIGIVLGQRIREHVAALPVRHEIERR